MLVAPLLVRVTLLTVSPFVSPTTVNSVPANTRFCPYTLLVLLAVMVSVEVPGIAAGHLSSVTPSRFPSLGVLELLHDVAFERFTGRFCNTSATCGACCRRCSEPC